MRQDETELTTGPDERMARLLRDVPADHTFTAARERALAARIRAAGAERLQMRRRVEHARARIRAYTRGVMSLGAAASLAILAVLFTTNGATTAETTVAQQGLGLSVPDRGTLIAASYSGASDEEFLGSLWGELNAESMIARSHRND